MNLILLILIDGQRRHILFPEIWPLLIQKMLFLKMDLCIYILTTDTDKAGVDNQKPLILWARANYDSSITIKLSEEITKESAENIANLYFTRCNSYKCSVR